MTTRILLTNDDGIDSPGLHALADTLRQLGEVWVVAPRTEVSACGHAVTLHSPLRVREVGERTFTVDGTPTDCVFLAVGHILPSPPDLLLSGINRGGNVAVDVTYSGTVGAAIEGALRGIPSIAVSRNSFQGGDYGPSAEIALHIARQVIARGLPALTCLSVNVPPLPRDQIRGVVPTALGTRHYSEDVAERVDPRGGSYIWIAGTDVIDEPVPGTDCIEVANGYATVTPISVDWTRGEALDELARWELSAW